MTRIINRPEDTETREARVRIPVQVPSAMFQGWGPKF